VPVLLQVGVAEVVTETVDVEEMLGVGDTVLVQLAVLVPVPVLLKVGL
jgi:hypothetical protein